MALKLGELNVILKADNRELERGLDKGERDFRRSGENMKGTAAATAMAIAQSLIDAGIKGGDGLARGVDGRLRDARGRFAVAGNDSGGSFLATLGSKLQAGMPDVFSKLNGPMTAGMVALAPVIAGGLASAVLLGLGGGVLAGGIALVANDPGVRAATDSLKNRFLDIDTTQLEADYQAAQERMTAAVTPQAKARAQKELTEAKKALDEARAYNRKNTSLRDLAKPFIEPVKRAMTTFGDAFERMGPSIGRIFDKMAPMIDKLAPGLASLLEKAMPGIEKAITASAPLFDKLAQHMPKIGDALNSFFNSLSKSGPGAVIFLDLILTTFEGLIRFWGNGIEFWSNTLEVLNTFFTEKVPAAWNWLVDKIKAGVDKIGGFFSGVKNWIVEKWDQVVGFVRGLPKKISRAASGMWDGIKNSFKSAINWIIRKWNDLSFRIPGLSVPGLGQVWGGATLSTPNIPMLAKGGTALTAGAAIVGERGPELLHMPRGATVQPLPAGGGLAGTLRVILQWPDGRVIRDQLVDAATLRGQSVGRYLDVRAA